MSSKQNELQIELKEILSEKSLRITQPRLEILKVLKKNHKPLTIAEIQEKLGDSSIDQATVYRTMDAFLKKRIVASYDFKDNFTRFEMIVDRDHHHHVICKKCGRVENIEECFSHEIEDDLKKKGYSEVTHYMEFFGICEKCK
ncbi:MAG TPA: Fur family transcriptional regulator [Ignavibacteria bacterium]|nr:Fur family transcriptional regulator [Ignavibacteria bacterium]